MTSSYKKALLKSGLFGVFQSIFICLRLAQFPHHLLTFISQVSVQYPSCASHWGIAANFLQRSLTAPCLHEFPSPEGEADHEHSNTNIKQSQIQIRATKGQKGKLGVEHHRQERVEGEMEREGMPVRSPEKQASRQEQVCGRFTGQISCEGGRRKEQEAEGSTFRLCCGSDSGKAEREGGNASEESQPTAEF